MLVINPMTADARVERTATAMAEAGWAVTVVATAGPALPDSEIRNGFTILRLPYGRPIKEAVIAQRTNSTNERSRQQANGTWGILQKLAYVRNYARYSAGGLRLKTRRSSLVWEEFWLSIGKRLPELVDEPQVIHAHDLGPLHTANELAKHWSGKPKIIYDSHELFTEQQPNWTRSEKYLWKRHEKRLIKHADAVITVSDGIAKELVRRHRLDDLPTVVHNSSGRPKLDLESPHIRCVTGLNQGQPLGVYIGNVKEGRGVRFLLEALPLVPDFHLALVGVGQSPYLNALLSSAESGGYRKRIHVVEAVPSATLPSFLRTATVGIHPMELTCMNHDLALPNKLFDYTFARIPIAVSDLKEMAAFVRRWSLGEVFAPGDSVAIADALTKIVDSGHKVSDQTLTEIETEFGWPSQQTKLLSVYGNLSARSRPIQRRHDQP